MFIECKVSPEIPSDFYIALRAFRAEKDDKKAQKIINNLTNIVSEISLKSFNNGRWFDVSKLQEGDISFTAHKMLDI